MADTLLTGTTLVEKESRSIGDVPVGGIVELDDTYTNVPDGFNLCDGSTINDSLSSYNGSAIPDLNTNYFFINPATAIPANPDIDDVAITAVAATDTAGENQFSFPANLPNGITITECIVYGNVGAEDEIWQLIEVDSSGGQVVMATAHINSADTTITNPTVDMENHSYGIHASIGTMAAADALYGARIKYTPRFKFIIRIR